MPRYRYRYVDAECEKGCKGVLSVKVFGDDPKAPSVEVCDEHGLELKQVRKEVSDKRSHLNIRFNRGQAGVHRPATGSGETSYNTALGCHIESKTQHDRVVASLERDPVQVMWERRTFLEEKGYTDRDFQEITEKKAKGHRLAEAEHATREGFNPKDVPRRKVRRID